MEFELKIMVFGKVPGAIWHYYSNGFRVLKGSALQLAAEPPQDPFWKPFWSPFWSQNPNKIARRAAKTDFGATQEAREGENGPENGSTTKRLDVENRTAAHPTRKGSRSTGRDIGRGKPLP